MRWRRPAISDRESAALTASGMGTEAVAGACGSRPVASVSTVSLRQTAESGMKLESASVGIIMDRVKNGRADLFYLGVDIVSRAVRDCLVIGAGNLMVLQNLPSNGSRRLILVSQRASDPSIQAHLNDDGLAVTSQWHDGVECAVILSGREVLGSFALSSLIATDGAAKSRRLESAYLYAIAAAFALGLTPAQIGDSLQSDVDLVDGED